MVKRTLLVVALVFFVVSVATAQISEILEETTSVEFVNDTGYDLYNVFFSPADSEYWGPDVLDSTTILSSGDSVEFLVHHPDRCNDFDFLAIDEDNDAYYLWNTTLCDDENNVIHLTLDDYSGEQAPDFDLVEMGFYNDTPYDMWLVFVSPADSAYVGVDFLGSSNILEPDEDLGMYVPAGSEETIYDVICFDEDGDRYQFQIGVDDSSSSQRWPIEMSDLQ